MDILAGSGFQGKPFSCFFDSLGEGISYTGQWPNGENIYSGDPGFRALLVRRAGKPKPPKAASR
jgi:hypothetical protein